MAGGGIGVVVDLLVLARGGAAGLFEPPDEGLTRRANQAKS